MNLISLSQGKLVLATILVLAITAPASAAVKKVTWSCTGYVSGRSDVEPLACWVTCYKIGDGLDGGARRGQTSVWPIPPFNQDTQAQCDRVAKDIENRYNQ